MYSPTKLILTFTVLCASVFALGAQNNQPKVTPPQIISTNTGISLLLQFSGQAPIKYQWYKNGTPILGSTMPMIVIHAQDPDATYYVIATNSGGATKSGSVKISHVANSAAPDVALTFRK